jgi:hypothetical protein
MMMNDGGVGVTGNISFLEEEHIDILFFLGRVSNLQNLNKVFVVSRSKN